MLPLIADSLKKGLLYLLLSGAAYHLQAQEKTMKAPQSGTAGKPVRIMMLGNSITHADCDYTGYRYHLWKMLVDAGWHFDFVGSNRGPFGKDSCHINYPDYKGLPFDDQHEGHSGWPASKVLEGWGDVPGLSGWMQHQDYPADIVLIHLGTNDAWAYNDVEEAVTRAYDALLGIIDTLQAGNPGITIYLARIIDFRSNYRIDDYYPEGYFNDYVQRLNERIDKIAGKKTTENFKVNIVDHYSTWTDADLREDGIHPNEKGELKIAGNWARALGIQFSHLSGQTH